LVLCTLDTWQFISFITSRVAQVTQSTWSIACFTPLGYKNKVMYWEKLCACWVVLAFGLYHISLFSVWNHCMKGFFAKLQRWNIRPQNNVKRMKGNVKKIYSKKCNMHLKNHDCSGKLICLKWMGTLFVSLVKIVEGETCRWDKIKCYCGCIGKIFVYKHCFCYLNVQSVKQKNSLFHQPIVLLLAY